MTDQTTHCGYVAIIGPPNAGKSTLMNQLVGGKVAIVSPKVQTTRSRITGIAVEGETQIIFLDTPGIFQPKKRLDRAMVHAAWEGVHDADLIAVIVDASRANPISHVRDTLERLKTQKKPTILLLNKVDQMHKQKLLVLATQFNEAFAFDDIFMISAQNNDGVDDLRAYFASKMPAGPWLYGEDEMTTVPMRLLAAEITREKIFLQLHEELPYSCTVETESFDESDPEKWIIEQTVYVERESQRAIVLGHKGQRLKEIGMAARKDMKAQFGVPVHLALFVKVRSDWQEDPERYRSMGLEFKV